jgi:hypothetical protein
MAGLVWAGAARAQPVLDSARSVVKITCSWDTTPGRKAGQMTASGFVWRDSRHVVTALHAAVGCSRLIVYSEFKKDSAPAQVVRAHLVSDLALLQFIDRDLGLAPIPELKGPPDTRGEFTTWGYPRGVRQMTDVRTEFAGGLARGATTLEAAYGGVAGLDELLAGQTHPQRGASILRVTSTLQPGQSGAPILDSQGRVVAVADGGLLGGYLTLNWSIPAHPYLAALPDSRDPIPSQPSKWAVLFSQVTPADSASQPETRVSGGGHEFRLVRQQTIADYVASNRSARFPDHSLAWLKKATSGPIEALSFDIYEEATIGTTIAIPTGFALRWNPEFRAFEARSASGAVRHFIGTQRLPPGPRAAVARAFAARFAPMADWERAPSAIDYAKLDANSAGEGGFVSGTGRQSGKQLFGSLFVQLDHGKFIGLATFQEGGNNLSLLSKEDLFFSSMITLSQRYTAFAVN